MLLHNTLLTANGNYFDHSLALLQIPYSNQKSVPPTRQYTLRFRSQFINHFLFNLVIHCQFFPWDLHCHDVITGEGFAASALNSA